MKRRINKKLLLGFIAPYLAIVLIVFAIQYISNALVLNALKSNVVEIIETSFVNDVGVIEQNLDKSKELAAIVAQNSAKKLERVQKDDKNFYSQIDEIRKEMSSYIAGESTIKEIYIQYDKADFIVGHKAVFSKRIYFYKNVIVSNEKTPDELLANSEKASGFDVGNICFYTDNVRIIPFVYPIPLLKDRTGSVNVLINERNMLTPVNDLLEKSNGTLRIADSEGQLVSMIGDESINPTVKKNGRNISINGANYYVFSAKGDSSKWDYEVFLPESYVLAKVQDYQTVSTVFNFIILIIGFGICLFFTIRKSRAYAGLLDALDIRPENQRLKGFVLSDEYSGIKQQIFKIKSENASLMQKGTQNVLRRILTGQLDKNEEIFRELKNHKIEISGPLYGIINISYSTDGAPEGISENSNSLLLGKVRETIPEARVCFIEKNAAAVIFSGNTESFKEIADTNARKIVNELLLKYNITSIAGIGNPVDSLNMISNSYSQAVEVTSYKFLTGNNELYFYDSLPDNDDYFYPLETENALFKSVRELDYESARKVLRDIYEENFVKRSLSVDSIKELLAELRASIKKICRMQTEYLEFSHKESSVKHFFENATSFIYMVCSENGENEESENQSRGQKICREAKNYIELHYNIPNLTLDMIAEEFRIHPNYLSSLFKKHTGSSIISYLERVRIEKATELLSSGKYTVNEVAASVGFANDSTFRRNFKKIKGISPSSFLKC